MSLQTHQIGNDPKTNQQYIRCRVCGMTSYNTGDIENLYCGNCHQFHPIGSSSRADRVAERVVAAAEELEDPKEVKILVGSLLHAAFLKEEADNLSMLRAALCLLIDLSDPKDSHVATRLDNLIQKFNVKYPKHQIEWTKTNLNECDR